MATEIIDGIEEEVIDLDEHNRHMAETLRRLADRLERGELYVWTLSRSAFVDDPLGDCPKTSQHRVLTLLYTDLVKPDGEKRK